MITAALLLALDDPRGRPGDNVAGLLAFLVVAVLIVASVFLYRSLRRQLTKIDFEEDRPTDRPTTGSAGSEPS